MQNKRKDPGIPYDETPRINPYFGQPEDCFDLINCYGTYNIQRTAESENEYPAIAQGLPKEQRNRDDEIAGEEWLKKSRKRIDRDEKAD